MLLFLKKWKEQQHGKKNNLTSSQIDLLNSIGLKWSTGGKGRYTTDPLDTIVKQEHNQSISGLKRPLSSPGKALTVATLLPTNSFGAATATTTDAHTMVTNLQLAVTDTTILNPNLNTFAKNNTMAQNTLSSLLDRSSMHSSGLGNNNTIAQNTLANLLGGTSQQKFGLGVTNEHNGFSATSLQNALQMPNTAAAADQAFASAQVQVQALQQQLLATLGNPPNNLNGINGIGIQTQQRNTNILQQLITSQQQQLTQYPIPHNTSGLNALQLQAPQNVSFALTNGYQQLLNR